MSRSLFRVPLARSNATSLGRRFTPTRSSRKASTTQIVVPSDQMPRGTDRAGIVNDRSDSNSATASGPDFSANELIRYALTTRLTSDTHTTSPSDHTPSGFTSPSRAPPPPGFAPLPESS